VESLPRELKAELSTSAFLLSASAAPPAAPPPFHPAYVPAAPHAPAAPAAPPAPPRERHTPVRVRLDLQQRAATNLRRHMLRALRRFAVLVVADLASFYVMREVVRAVREYAWLGDRLATQVGAALPPGILNGWQYAAALFVGLLLTGNYGRGDRRRNPQALFFACALATALPLWMTIWTRGLEPVIVQYAITTALVWAGLVAERRVVDRIVARVQPPERDRLDTLFVGSGPDCVSAMASPAFTESVEHRPIGFVDSHAPSTPGALGDLRDFSLLLAGSGAQVVVVCGYVTDRQFQDIVETALTAGCQVLSVPRSFSIAGVHPTTVWRRGQPLVELTAPSLKGWQHAVKRAVDVTGAIIGLVVLSPVFAILAAIVKLESPGPVFFTQERVGRGGRLFRIIKFRTMVNGADKRRDELLSRSVYGDARLFKVRDDPRMTRIGGFLRRTSLDELPQLVNVLRGEMSLVGPRPPLPSEVALYEEHHYARFDVKPGITGPWQVNGRNQVTDFEQVIALETRYIREWSLLSDIGILFRTVWVVAQMRGAH
jgi:exopolysaccharide biosynthesis polyprenyl glycosylphosphotransferase